MNSFFYLAIDRMPLATVAAIEFVAAIVIALLGPRTSRNLVALGVAMPIGFAEVVPVLSQPTLVIAGIGVGISSSVIPYVCDQLAMARLSRAAFALMLTLLPPTATLVGIVVLAQTPTKAEFAGILLVAAGIGIHKPAE